MRTIIKNPLKRTLAVKINVINCCHYNPVLQICTHRGTIYNVNWSFCRVITKKNILIISPWKGINGFKELLHCTFCCLLWVIWSLEIENHLGTYRIENIYGVIKLPCNSFSFLTATATRLCLFVLAVLCRSLEPPFLYGLLGTWEMGAVIYWDANTNWKMVYKDKIKFLQF